MDFMDPFRRRYTTGMPAQPFPGPPPVAQAPPQYPYWNPLMAYYHHQQHRAALMGQGGLMAKPAEPKPRLAKEEVELLEREFAKNQKPSSTTKRELAEQMGVEVPRINNWFQNRRAKEKQLKKTAEFEAQQARERAASEAAKAAAEQAKASESGENTNAVSSQDQKTQNANSPSASDNVVTKTEPTTETSPPDSRQTAPGSGATGESPNGSESDGHVPVDYAPSQALSTTAFEIDRPITATAPANEFGDMHRVQNDFQQEQQMQFAFRLAENRLNAENIQHQALDAMTPRHNSTAAMSDAGAFSPFSEPDYFATPLATTQFPSEMVTATTPMHAEGNPLLKHETSMESLAHSDAVSPSSIPDSPLTLSNLRFKSPPPPADIAGRRKSRRPAPLGLTSLRSTASGPKTGIDMPRRSDTVSPMRRISSATGLNRIAKPFVPPGPRSPFTMDRNKEALLQTLQETQQASTSMPTLSSAMAPPMTHDEMLASTAVGNGGVHISDDEQNSYPFGSLANLEGMPFYNGNADQNPIKSPLGTPGLGLGTFADAYFPTSLENHQAWNYTGTQPDDPLPTPSLCSHGGSELEFSMAPALPGYVASQPVTPSFPPPAVAAAAAASMGPTFPPAGFFGNSGSAPTGSVCGPSEYHFPDSSTAVLSSSYPDCSGVVRGASPPGGIPPPKPLAQLAGAGTKQFQFAQNITPQDFSSDKQ